MTPLRKSAGITDAALLLLGIAGFVLLFRLLPVLHPDAAADYRLGPDGAIETARGFLRDNGYEAGTADPEATFERDTGLLDTLQERMGRPGAVDLLKADTAHVLPAYYWNVEWTREAAVEEDNAPVFTLSLTSAGRVWDFRKLATARPAVLRRALAGLGADPAEEEVPRLPETISDSLLRASLIFTDSEAAWQDPLDRPLRLNADSVWQALEASRQALSLVEVGPEWAVGLARYHLNRSALAGYDLQVDSAWTGFRTDGKTARVLFAGRDPLAGQAVTAEVEVHVTGALLELDSEFTSSTAGRSARQRGEGGPPPGEEASGLTVTGNVTLSGILQVVSIVTYLILVVGFLFLFFRHLHARAIDIKVALRDALWGGLGLAAVVALSAGYDVIQAIPNPWLGFFIASVMVSLSGAAGAIIIFIVSNAVDPLAREVWPGKLESLTLMRLGFLRNVPVGLSLLRGVALGGVLIGLIVGALAAWPDVLIDFDDQGAALRQSTLSPIGLVFGLYAFAGLFIMLLIPLGAGTLLYQRKPTPWIVVPGLVLLFVLVQLGPASLAPAGSTLLQAGLLGAALAVAFWQYDALTCFFGYLVAGLFWELAPAWIMNPSPLAVDGLAALVLAGVVVLVGLVGVLSGRTEAELPSYVPSYVQEMAREERLKGELEIAHMVQESFLPKKMPKVAGLDVAAMCLAAQEVGGDYYDFVELGNGRLALVVGDVSGKGIQAAFYMTLVKGFFITLSRTIGSPAEILRRINTMFCENAPRGMFISLICGILDTEARTFTFARAGHNPLILKRSPSQEPEFVQPAGMAIGLVTGPRFNNTIEEVAIPLRSGDVLVLYTDGFTEAMNAHRQQYGDARLAQKVNGAVQRSAVEILRSVSEDVHHFLEAVGRQDDMTMMVLKLEPRPSHVVSASVRKETPPRAELPQTEAGV